MRSWLFCALLGATAPEAFAAESPNELRSKAENREREESRGASVTSLVLTPESLSRDLLLGSGGQVFYSSDAFSTSAPQAVGIIRGPAATSAERKLAVSTQRPPTGKEPTVITPLFAIPPLTSQSRGSYAPLVVAFPLPVEVRSTSSTLWNPGQTLELSSRPYLGRSTIEPLGKSPVSVTRDGFGNSTIWDPNQGAVSVTHDGFGNSTVWNPTRGAISVTQDGFGNSTIWDPYQGAISVTKDGFGNSTIWTPNGPVMITKSPRP